MANRPRIAFATCAWLPQLTPDDHVLRRAVAAAGMRAVPTVWDDQAVEWGAFDGCVLRSAWDYHLKRDAFVSWAERTADVVPMFNSAKIVTWNTDKRYLRWLSDLGIPTIPTYWASRCEVVDLEGLLCERRWHEAVIKPTVGLGAINLVRVGRNQPDAQRQLDELLCANDVMIQPFVPSVERRGELSLIFVDGELSHAVRKTPRVGDFRVQPMWGGSVAEAQPDARHLDAAQRALATLDSRLLYARVDLVDGPDGEPWVIELELVDPNLFFGEAPWAAERFAAALRAAIGS